MEVLEIVNILISVAVAPFILHIFKNKIEEKSISKLYNLRSNLVDGYFYSYWLGISFLLNFIVFGFVVLLYDNFLDILDPNKINIESFIFNIIMNIYILFLLNAFSEKVRNHLKNKRILNILYSYFLLYMPSIFITTLIYFEKMLNDNISIFIVLIFTLIFCVLGLYNFSERYDIYPCEVVNIKLNDGSKIRGIECKNIKVTSKMLIIQKKCNRTCLDLNTVVRIDFFGDKVRVDHESLFEARKKKKWTAFGD
jgi:magnesium-transporting ATPase (P-type)